MPRYVAVEKNSLLPALAVAANVKRASPQDRRLWTLASIFTSRIRLLVGKECAGWDVS